MYHGGDTEDLKEAIDYIWEEHCENGRKRKLFGMGISLGAGVLTNYACKAKDSCPLTVMCSVGCHFDTFKAMEFLSNHLYGLYDYCLGYWCKIASIEIYR